MGNGHFSVPFSSDGIKFGESNNKSELSDRVQSIANLFDKAGVPYEIPENMIREQWRKFMLNVSGNSTNTLLRGTHSYFQKVNAANQARKILIDEIFAVAKKLKTGLTDADVQWVMEAYNNYPASNKNSMLQDFESGKQTENEMFCGYLVDLGKKLKVPTPVNQYVYFMIKALDEINSGILE
ncbi:ketopantoate reductase family protein [Leuconostoc pseudomesenteroides]|uniref:Ketopantoate reductase C-terminal domain-containing protein n=1 Tax=Leuconostoc pseudomesenteroides TaxID=33968 RepID=A0ABT6HF34_LEUPS|nr:ketopantoate reductase C-terminal domain-containing protein [Leuconostoc pseudomesenteroides]MDG9734444.1 ketopantoate reductase C-terminal domain-containing protein [Leuconostoc pseudomesenteroides]NKZ36687.1 hypothetical protein [Leuconostoc pseudomesenteroides]QQB26479.1 hypothetical protein I6H60_05140 [Leuconostoc pseudomesenteroides]